MGTHSKLLLPVDVIFHPDWWHTHYGLDFGPAFHFNPEVRVESERCMRQALYDRFGDLGLMDATTPDENVRAIFEVAEDYRRRAG